MKYAILIPLAAILWAGALPAQAQSRVWRCGNTYTNDVNEAQNKGCKPLEGGNVTVVEGTRVQAPPRAGANTPATPSSQRVDNAQQRARDDDARQILQDELKRAQERHAALLKEYNNGEPEKLGPETRNYQKYLDRVSDLKASIARSEADIAGIQRELARLSASK